jgi:hypothetical protein
MRGAAGLGAAVVAVLLAGCAGGPARPAPEPTAAPPSPANQAAAADARQRLAAAEAVCQQVAADPTFAPLHGRVLTLDPSSTWTRDMMVDRHYVDARDRALLVVMDERRARCRQALITASPDQAVPLLDYWARQDKALVQLYDGRIPIGFYNRAMADAQSQFAVDVANQRADNAVRANEHLANPPSSGAARVGAPISPDSYRALLGR